jgi:hypothetical protein
LAPATSDGGGASTDDGKKIWHSTRYDQGGGPPHNAPF